MVLCFVSHSCCFLSQLVLFLVSHGVVFGLTWCCFWSHVVLCLVSRGVVFGLTSHMVLFLVSYGVVLGLTWCWFFGVVFGLPWCLFFVSHGVFLRCLCLAWCWCFVSHGVGSLSLMVLVLYLAWCCFSRMVFRISRGVLSLCFCPAWCVFTVFVSRMVLRMRKEWQCTPHGKHTMPNTLKYDFNAPCKPEVDGARSSGVWG